MYSSARKGQIRQREFIGLGLFWISTTHAFNGEANDWFGPLFLRGVTFSSSYSFGIINLFALLCLVVTKHL